MVAWLLARTPSGAPVLPLHVGDVPLTRIPREGLPASIRTLVSNPKRAEVLIDALLGDVPLRNGVPTYTPGLRRDRWPVLIKSDQHGKGAKLVGKAYWELEVAYARDIEGETNQQVAEMLGLVDHLHAGNNRSKNADLWATSGRRLLAALGAWPWTHAPHGRLSRKWRSDKGLYEAFEQWRRRAFVDAQLALEAARTGDLGFPKVADFEAARRLYEHGLAASCPATAR